MSYLPSYSEIYQLCRIIEATRGIDAEVADFFADSSATKGVVIDDALNRRLRMMVHKRVLVVMVTTYFAQALDKGYAGELLGQ